MKTALVCGAGGFIGGHLVKKLKREGYWVWGVDIKHPEFAMTKADGFWILDLRDVEKCQIPFRQHGKPFDEVYQLAADMGGMGYIHSAECDIMHNSALININMIDAAVKARVPRYFFSSSVCVYPDMQPGDPEMLEAQAIPANPDNEYGWEKLYAERMALAYARNYPIEVRIARFQNCYDAQTEIMTQNGFKFFADISFDDEIATLNQETGYIEYHKPIAIQSYNYTGPMYKIANQRIDLFVTPDHSMYYCTKGNLNRLTPWRLGKISEIDNYATYYVTRKANWLGRDRNTFVLEGVSSGGGTCQQKGRRKEIPVNLWLIFLGWFLTEGSAFHTKKNYVVSISKYSKEVRKEIAQVIEDMGFHPHWGTPKSIRVLSKQLFYAVAPFGHASEKFIPRWCLSLPKERLSILLDTLMRGDGDKNRNRYSTTSKQLADDVAEIAIKLGYGVLISTETMKSGNEIYRVRYSKEGVHKIQRKHRSIVHYSGGIYDVTVPNHTLLVRRNGKTVWSGNCYGTEGTWRGGREKAPAAICRKVAEADDGGTIEVWGDGTAERSYTYVDDMVDGIYQLMQSSLQGPVNIGTSERVSVDRLVDTVIGISGKDLLKKYVDGPVGVRSRNFSKERISSLGWRANTYFRDGIARTYRWVEEQVNEHR